jgi:hypothetical protein
MVKQDGLVSRYNLFLNKINYIQKKIHYVFAKFWMYFNLVKPGHPLLAISARYSLEMKLLCNGQLFKKLPINYINKKVH